MSDNNSRGVSQQEDTRILRFAQATTKGTTTNAQPNETKRELSEEIAGGCCDDKCSSDPYTASSHIFPRRESDVNSKTSIPFSASTPGDLPIKQLLPPRSSLQCSVPTQGALLEPVCFVVRPRKETQIVDTQNASSADFFHSYISDSLSCGPDSFDLSDDNTPIHMRSSVDVASPDSWICTPGAEKSDEDTEISVNMDKLISIFQEGGCNSSKTCDNRPPTPEHSQQIGYSQILSIAPSSESSSIQLQEEACYSRFELSRLLQKLRSLLNCGTDEHSSEEKSRGIENIATVFIQQVSSFLTYADLLESEVEKLQETLSRAEARSKELEANLVFLTEKHQEESQSLKNAINTLEIETSIRQTQSKAPFMNTLSYHESLSTLHDFSTPTLEGECHALRAQVVMLLGEKKNLEERVRENESALEEVDSIRQKQTVELKELRSLENLNMQLVKNLEEVKQLRDADHVTLESIMNDRNDLAKEVDHLQVENEKLRMTTQFAALSNKEKIMAKHLELAIGGSSSFKSLYMQQRCVEVYIVPKTEQKLHQIVPLKSRVIESLKTNGNSSVKPTSLTRASTKSSECFSSNDHRSRIWTWHHVESIWWSIHRSPLRPYTAQQISIVTPNKPFPLLFWMIGQSLNLTGSNDRNVKGCRMLSRSTVSIEILGLKKALRQARRVSVNIPPMENVRIGTQTKLIKLSRQAVQAFVSFPSTEIAQTSTQTKHSKYSQQVIRPPLSILLIRNTGIGIQTDTWDPIRKSNLKRRIVVCIEIKSANRSFRGVITQPLRLELGGVAPKPHSMVCSGAVSMAQRDNPSMEKCYKLSPGASSVAGTMPCHVRSASSATHMKASRHAEAAITQSSPADPTHGAVISKASEATRKYEFKTGKIVPGPLSVAARCGCPTHHRMPTTPVHRVYPLLSDVNPLLQSPQRPVFWTSTEVSCSPAFLAPFHALPICTKITTTVCTGL